VANGAVRGAHTSRTRKYRLIEMVGEHRKDHARTLSEATTCCFASSEKDSIRCYECFLKHVWRPPPFAPWFLQKPMLPSDTDIIFIEATRNSIRAGRITRMRCGPREAFQTQIHINRPTVRTIPSRTKCGRSKARHVGWPAKRVMRDKVNIGINDTGAMSARMNDGRFQKAA
jgi:hypothetical protein